MAPVRRSDARTVKVPLLQETANKWQTAKEDEEASPELLRHDDVDEWIDPAIDEADEVGCDHREEEVGSPQEAVRSLDLTDEAHQIKRCPGDNERYRDEYHNPGHLIIEKD